MQGLQALVVIGIGGSYLGTRAIIEALQPPFTEPKVPVYFAGCHMDSAYHRYLLEHLKQKRYALNVISKSGTTLEPALAFRLFWQDLTQHFPSDEYKSLILVTTDESKGKLKEFAVHHKLTTFSIPDDVGGRFSVLSAVGLVPLSIAGIDIRALIKGALEMRQWLQKADFSANPGFAVCRLPLRRLSGW